MTNKLFNVGTYLASSQGHNGEIQLEVTFTEEELTEIIIKEP